MATIGQRLRDDIVAGELPLGSRITIDDLATRYGVSHMPVREALRELHGEGLVVIEPHRGARVRPVDAAFVENLFDMRSALEVVLTRRAARDFPRPEIAELHRVQIALDAHIARGDYRSAIDANRAFHQIIYRNARSADALGVIDRHWTLIAALWRRFGYGPDRFAGVASDHRHLLVALEDNDSEAAGVIMAAHVLKARQDLLRQVRLDASASKEAAA